MNRSIFRLAIPNIISNITVPLLGMVDMFIVGHLDSEDYIGAIALATMLFNFIYWSFSFLRMGTSGFTAQAYGADNTAEQTNILLRSLTVAMIGGILIILLQYFIALVGFYFLDAGPSVRGYAQEYFYIYVWAAPAVLGMYTFNGWYVGMQNAKIPMVIAIGVNIVNIGLSFLLVYGFGMKIGGVAIATLCAQYSGFLASLFIWNVKYGYLKQYFNFEVLRNLRSYIPFFKVNSDIFIRTMALVAVTTFFMSASAKSGKDILAVNALLMQMFILFSYMMDGFAYAAEALTGKFIGANDRGQLKLLVKKLFLWGIIIVSLFTLVYALFLDQILAILTDKQNIIELAKQYQFWVLLIPVAGFAAFLWDGVFVGATASHQMRNSMLIAVSAFFLIYFAFSDVSANNILWFAFIMYLALRGIVQSFMAPAILRGSR
ncbi:MATE family multidrug resistance protein [Dysgonomonas sp. PFB1-18]|uniref:MATE family efflux transporter n=1 Tax=unclassified Dysgonomonas TaxID=2630389 RepID=UPI0024742FF5|nr:MULTISPECIES: MATE family efflux transporter [unclassified Dysgonomonas]MDH6309898.1 MATE family multidrug resistance protein [Dysgonomonas sp. PF1-14]MDH6339442.1 MATE family multidrug resistance protein [Dysgonomonas sp. PF1-16]MDH6380941.1 MATE family multidrug resistance protein [Dysgonomonas sp. PFB1-18]MDH6397950.1 MATE family multidrug resistance protein [Dysgonomonas sp. PF1-23]